MKSKLSIELADIGERLMIVEINGDFNFKNYLLANGLAVGTIITKNYSPKYAQLINFSIAGKMLSLRKFDFLNIECVKV